MTSISSTSAPQSGLERTAASIQRGQQAYDLRAEELVRATQRQSEPGPTEQPQRPKPTDVVAEPEPDLAQAAVAFREQALVNQVLYQTFRAQADQQRDLTKALPGA